MNTLNLCQIIERAYKFDLNRQGETCNRDFPFTFLKTYQINLYIQGHLGCYSQRPLAKESQATLSKVFEKDLYSIRDRVLESEKTDNKIDWKHVENFVPVLKIRNTRYVMDPLNLTTNVT